VNLKSASTKASSDSENS